MSTQALQQALSSAQAAEAALATQYRSANPLSAESWKDTVVGTLKLQAAATAFAQELRMDDGITSSVLDAIR